MVLAVIALCVGGGWWWIKRWWKAAETEPLTVRIERVARGDLLEVVQAPGEIQPRTKVSISARVAARIVDLPFKEGDSVTSGNPNAAPPIPPSLLVKLDSTDLEAALRSTEARYAAQKAQISQSEALVAVQKSAIDATSAALTETRRELVREQQLLRTLRISQAEYDTGLRKTQELQAQLDGAMHTLDANHASLAATKHNLEAAEAEITRARDNLSYSTLTSPIDGVVTRLNAKVGELVVTGTMNNPGTVIMEVADLSRMLMIARVDESAVCDVRMGQPAKVRIQAYPDRMFDGTVTAVSLASSQDQQTAKHFKTEITLQTTDTKILSGLTADADIETSRHANVLKVPSQSVLARNLDDIPAQIRENNPNIDKKKTQAIVVFKAQNNKAAPVPVTIGPSDATHTVIKSGLNEGDRIVVGPYKVLDGLKNDKALKNESETTQTKTAGGAPAGKADTATSEGKTH